MLHLLYTFYVFTMYLNVYITKYEGIIFKKYMRTCTDIFSKEKWSLLRYINSIF